MIISFANKETEKVFRGEFSSRFPPHIQNKALNKLRILNNVNELEQVEITDYH
jgi:proteic killer suppression protein